MSYMVILNALVLFLSSMLLHVIIWRFLKTKRQVWVLFIVLVLIPAATVFLIIGFLSPQQGGFLISDWLGVLLMHLSFSSAYILSYPAIQAKCPSLTMLLLIEDSTGRRCTLEELSLAFSDESLRDARINDLVNDSMIVYRDNDYYMTPKGKAFLWPLIILRRLLGLPTGKG